MKELYAALAKAQGEYRMAEADSTSYYKNKFASYPALLAATRPALTKYGLAVIQIWHTKEDGSFWLQMILTHSSGEHIDSWVKLTPTKNDLCSLGGFKSHISRYMYRDIVGAPDDDDDAKEVPIKQEDDQYAAIPPKPTEKVSQDQIDQLNYELRDHPDITKSIYKWYKIEELRDIPKSQFLKTINQIREIKERKKKN